MDDTEEEEVGRSAGAGALDVDYEGRGWLSGAAGRLANVEERKRVRRQCRWLAALGTRHRGQGHLKPVIACASVRPRPPHASNTMLFLRHSYFLSSSWFTGSGSRE